MGNPRRARSRPRDGDQAGRHPSSLDAATAARMRAERARDRSERRYRSLVEQSLGLICVHDLDGTLISVNAAAARSLGYGPGEGIGRNLREFLAPAFRPLFDEYLQRIKAVGEDAGLMRVLAHGGAERIWMYRNVMYEEPDEAPYVLGHAIDVTERISAERALRSSQEALEHAYAELDVRVQERTRELQEANARLSAEIEERSRAEQRRERALVHERDTLAFLAETSELFAGVLDVDAVVSTLGRMPVPFFADALLVHVVLEDGTMRCAAGHQLGAGSREQVARVIGTVVAVDDCLLARAVASGRHELCPDIRVGDYWRLFGPGEGEGLARDLEVRAAVFVPLVGEGGTMAVVSYLSSTDGKLTSADAPMIEDLTRRFRLLLERVRLYREAHDANRLKDEFLTTLSHELRTPLNAILGWAKVLRTRPLDERILHPLEVIERNAAAQARLVEEILDVSRIMTGKLHLEVAPVDLQAVIRAAIDAIGPEAQARELQIIEHVDAAEAAVNGDAHRLQQVVWNLLSNAVKFTEPGGAITVRLVRADDGFQVCVTDTGEGIAAQDLPFVFDRFRQADASTTRHHGGLGLGLAIVRYMVELHGGSVTASSPGVGQGATFTVYLPSPGVSGRPALTEGTAAVRDEREPSVSTRRRPLSGRRVLVVEDNDDTRELIVEMLEAAGASVTAAATSRNAFDAFTNALPDAVVADIGLPGEDGYALMRRIRALPGNAGGFVPAVAVTAYVRMEDRKQALAAGFQQHVAKPVDPVQLVDAIASML